MPDNVECFEVIDASGLRWDVLPDALFAEEDSLCPARPIGLSGAPGWFINRNTVVAWRPSECLPFEDVSPSDGATEPEPVCVNACVGDGVHRPLHGYEDPEGKGRCRYCAGEAE